jgi:accessory colonization factor AcfC
MTTKTEIKTTQIPDDVRVYVPEILGALRRALETGDFAIEIIYDSIAIKIPDITAYVDNRKIYIIYKDIGIVYSDYVAKVKVFRDQYDLPDEYYAHEYWAPLQEIHELALQKVRERIEKALKYL